MQRYETSRPVLEISNNAVVRVLFFDNSPGPESGAGFRNESATIWWRKPCQSRISHSFPDRCGLPNPAGRLRILTEVTGGDMSIFPGRNVAVKIKEKAGFIQNTPST